MGKVVTATQLRADAYKIVDRVLKSGRPQELTRGNRRLLIVSADTPRLDLDKLPKRRALNCTPDELINTSWEDEWKPRL